LKLARTDLTKGGSLMSLLLTGLDSRLSLDLVIWMFPVAFLIHDLEEILTTERFSRENRERFPKFLRGIATISTTQFIVAVVVLLVLTVVAAYLATSSPRELLVLTLTLGMFLVHVVGHIAFPIFFRRYTPGLITAIVIVFPYSLYAFYRLFSTHLIKSESFNLSLLLGALLVAPLIWLALFVGKWLTER
jgi:hypothetical protein